jgi:hypothetical protein
MSNKATELKGAALRLRTSDASSRETTQKEITILEIHGLGMGGGKLQGILINHTNTDKLTDTKKRGETCARTRHRFAQKRHGVECAWQCFILHSQVGLAEFIGINQSIRMDSCQTTLIACTHSSMLP